MVVNVSNEVCVPISLLENEMECYSGVVLEVDTSCFDSIVGT